MFRSFVASIGEAYENIVRTNFMKFDSIIERSISYIRTHRHNFRLVVSYTAGRWWDKSGVIRMTMHAY